MRRSLNACLACLAAGALAIAPAVAAGVDFTAEEKRTLAAGKPVPHELSESRKGGFYGGTTWVLVDAPVEQVWAAINDWDRYTRIFPNTYETTEVSRKGDRSLVRMKLGHPVISVTYHLEMTRDAAARQLSFKQVSTHASDLDDIRGYWRLFPQKNGKTLVAYVVAFQVPMGIVNLVGPRLENEFMNGILGVPKYVKRWTEKRGAALYGE